MTENDILEESPKRGSDRFIIGGAVAVFIALMILFLGFGLGSDSSTNPRNVSLPTRSAQPTPTETFAVEPTETFAVEPTEEPEEIPTEANKPDVDTSSLASQLAVVANRFGYGPADESYADIIESVVCSPIESGIMTWEDSVAEDIASGAPESDARGFNAYARTVFCPGMGYDVG